MIARQALFPIVGLFLALALLTVLAGRETQAQMVVFNPTSEVCLDNALTGPECDGSRAPGASDDTLAKTVIPAPNPNFGGLVGFIPADFTVARDADIPDGAVTGTLSSVATLGLLNAPCFNTIVVDFVMVDGTVNTANTVAPAADNSLDPLAEDANGNGVFDGADKYPSYLLETFPNAVPIARQIGMTEVSGTTLALNFLIFEPGADISDEITVDPSLGFPSVTVLQNPGTPPQQSVISDFCTPLITELVTFGQTRDNPCTPAGALPGCPATPILPCLNKTNDDPADDVKVNDGCPQVGDVAESGAECDNDVSDDPEDPIVNDGCPTSGAAPEAFIPDPDGCDTDDNEASCTYRANPSADGTYNFVTFTVSQRDADGDGIENSLDVCALIANPDWDPRAANEPTDADNDGLPDECDPKPGTPSLGTAQTCPEGFTGLDEDQDCFSNRQDNCPLIANDLSDKDSDGIGDACDVTSGGDPLFGNSQNGPDVADGARAALCIVNQITVGAGGTAASTQVPPCSAPPTNGGGPTPTPAPTDDMTVAREATGPTGGGVGGPDTGVGALAPAISSIPTWAASASGLGGAGLLGGLGAFFSRIFHIRLPRWRGRSRRPQDD